MPTEGPARATRGLIPVNSPFKPPSLQGHKAHLINRSKKLETQVSRMLSNSTKDHEKILTFLKGKQIAEIYASPSQ